MITAGLIGAGRWGRVLAKSFSRKCTIKTVTSLGNPGNIEKLKKILPSVKEGNLKDILEDPTINAVIIAAPIKNLSNIAIQCLDSNKHVFLEKPAGQNKKEILEIIKAKKDKVCLVDYLFLEDPSYKAFKNAISSFKITEFSTSWKKWGSFNNDILLNLVTHELAMLFDLFGKSLSVKDFNIFEDSCRIKLAAKQTKISVIIDRRSSTSKKLVTCISNESSYHWSPGLFSFWDKESNEDSPIFEKDVDLVDIQRDRFIHHVLEDDGFSNLEIACNIINIIDEMTQE